MTLYFGPEETASIKINGNKITGSGNTYTEIIEAGSYTLTKDKSVNLFYIKLEPIQGGNTNPDPDPQPQYEPYTLTVTTAGVATLYLGFDAVIPDADFLLVTAVTQVDGTKAYFKQIKGGIIPANTGVMIFANPGEYSFQPSDVQPTEEVNSLLHGVLTQTSVSDLRALEDGAYIFVLSRGIEEYTGFKKAESTVKYIPANRAYLPVSQSVEVKTIYVSFWGQETTDIDDIKILKHENSVNTNNQIIYDLTGRRVTNPGKGIYIINGQKFLFK